MKAILGIACLLFAPTVLSAEYDDGPFGITIGSDIDEYSSCSPVEGTPGYYQCASVPNPHSAFDFYVVFSTQSQGVCLIRGVGENLDDTSYGVATKSKTDEIAGQIASNYGEHTSIMDQVLPDFIWDSNSDWLMAIRQSERMYAYVWDSEEGYTPRNGVSQVYVAAAATGRSTGYVTVEFVGENNDDCQQEVSDQESSVF